MDIRNSTFIVTGGSSGLGQASVEMIVSNGGSVVIADVSQTGEALAQKLGKQARFAVTDVSNEEQAKPRRSGGIELRWFARPGELRGYRGGRKNGGQGGAALLAKFTKVITVNLIGTFNMIRSRRRNVKGQPTRQASAA
jgi:NAD(P)-dependent dehydrogenase (short-subunit alcohol dehydrogenase family)